MRHLPITLATVAALAAATAAPARADTVTDWNDAASTAIVGVAKQPPPVAIMSFAMTQGAVYDAVEAIDGRYRPYLATPPAGHRDSEDAAAATAAFRVLSGLFPAQQAALQARYDASMAALPAGPRTDRGSADGAAAAAAMLAARADDGRFGPFTITYGTLPGQYRQSAPNFGTDPAPWVGNVRPFLVPSVDMLRVAGPNPLTSRAYARDFNEVKSVGALHATGTARTPDETDAAIFWQENAWSLYNRAFRTLAATNHLSLEDSARMLAMTNLAGADAGIGCWHEKYRWGFWRPITAIREADTDGNPATTADPGWLPLFDPSTSVAPGAATLVTPSFPDNPSGHLCATSAVVRTLQHFFGRDRVPLTLTSTESDTTRHFAHLSDILREVMNARVWAGIHFRTADIQGAQLGTTVARYERRHYFEPVHGH